MAVSNVGDRKSYDCADDTSFDYQGYCLTVDGNGDVVKATQTDPFLGVNFFSSKGPEDEVIESGDPVPVEQDGWVNMLCSEGNEYNIGDPVYLSQTAGVADNVADTGATGTDDTRVGTVMRHRDLTGDSSPKWVVVSITGHV